jgi:hypothetical protein
VLRNAQRADALTTERYDYILGEQYKSQPPHSAPLPDLEAPKLPPRQPAPAPAVPPVSSAPYPLQLPN